MQARIPRIAIAALLASVAISSVQAQGARPSFTGTWELDVAHSDETQSTPTAATYTITQRGDTLVYDRSSTSARGTTQTHVVLGFDGKPWRNVVAQNGTEVATTSTVSWTHDTLVIRSSGVMNESAVETYERWWLAADGRSLGMYREVTFAGQVYSAITLRFNRTDVPRPLTRPDFSGVWLFDSARSEPSTFNPKSATWTVTQRGDSIVLDRVSPNGAQQAVYLLNGAPHKFTLRLVGPETEATATVTWNDASMIVHTTSHPGDIDLVQNDTWTLSANGKELRIRREATQNGGSIGMPTWVFARKP